MEFNPVGASLQGPKPSTFTEAIQKIMSQFREAEKVRSRVLKWGRKRVLHTAQVAGLSTDIAMNIIEELENEVEDALRE